MPINNLAEVQDINRIVAQLNNDYDIAPEKFYDKMLLDTIKLGQEHYVHLANTQTFTIPRGTKQIQKRRWGGLTAHTTPLREGIPPRPDKTSMEYITFTATQFGRWMEFTDRVDLDQIDPQIAHYTKELGDVMVRTLERYARETMLSSATRLFANNRTSIGELQVGDKISIQDLRFMTLRMKRLLVKPDPKTGYFNYICSPEEIHDLIDDPTVQKYMEINNSTKNLYQDGKPFPLFSINFIPTMLDEFYTPELDNPGEYYDGEEMRLRVYAVDDNGDVWYQNLDESHRSITEEAYLSDGTAIDDLVEWDISAPSDGDTVYKNGEEMEASDASDVDGVDLTELSWGQLPVHRGILYGKDGLVKTAIENEDNVQTIVQALGSAGANDPLHQRQTIGAKINSVGYGLLRDEAVAVTYSVPTNAIYTSDLTAEAVSVEHNTQDEEDSEDAMLSHREYTVPSDEEQYEDRDVLENPHDDE